MINVIINADDLGKSSEVNSEIDYALSKGYISSSTILANTSHWPEIHRIVDSHPQASFGIHLNLSEGKALTNSEILKKYGIVDSRNIFTGNILQTLNSDKVEEDLREAIYDEWDAQLDLLINVERIRITHLDGHHHVHHYYVLSDVLCRLIDKYGIRLMRRRVCYPTDKLTSFLGNIVEAFACRSLFCLTLKMKNRFNQKIFSFLHSHIESALWQKKFKEVCVSDYFDSYLHFVSNAVYRAPKNALVELMCHPGSDKYGDEYNLVKSDLLSRSTDCRIISYSQYLH
jgi:predicted glycoside hydrolase/deacetylase ChbG (UPF0249 family)